MAVSNAKIVSRSGAPKRRTRASGQLSASRARKAKALKAQQAKADEANTDRAECQPSEGDADDGNANTRQMLIHADAVVVEGYGNGQEATNSASNPGQTNEKKHKHGLRSKSAMKRKINSAQPRNEEEREASQRCMTMWGYVKYPQGPQIKESRQSHLVNFFLPKKSSTTITKLQVKVDPNPKRASYGQYD